MRLEQVNLLELYHKWLSNAGYFECYVRTSVFATAKHYKEFQLDESNISSELYYKVCSILKKYDEKETIFLLDFPDSEAIKLAYFINNNLAIKPILTFNMLLHDYGLVGSKDFVNALVVCGNKLKEIDPKGYAFILDYYRYREFEEEAYLKGFNNQYEVSDEVLPEAGLLKNLGYKKIVYVSVDKEKEDILNYLNYLKDNKFLIEKYMLEMGV
ncbi:hypothetical protein IAI10_19655 [Clostridium sp. 19966]|uniref:hypothetical protein n=1 Tax=Clostridium sp. 19966 TaxID=2768166 RepID=UPI0028DDD4E0|nr:hypothetical protein [Clostridium sp. 19966]MDT8718874.1 hypothetical protein [Clostridium sp. 19966]